MNAAIGPIEIFKTGQHVAMGGQSEQFPLSMLQEVADSYNGGDFMAPVVVGHPTTDAPAYGWIDRLSVEGDKLIAVLRDVDPAFAEIVRAGRYRKVSASFWRPGATNNPAGERWGLKHVGFLGAAAPAVKGLKPVSMAGDGNGTVTFGEDDIEDLPAHLVQRLQRRENDLFLEKVIEQGRVLPVFKTDLLSFMDNLDNGAVVAFADGRERGLLDWFRRFLESQPAVVSFGAIDLGPDPTTSAAMPNFRAPDGYDIDHDGMDLHRRAKRIAADRNISFAEAVAIAERGE